MLKQICFLFLFLSVSTVEAGRFISMQQHEETAEITGLKISLDSKLNGRIILEQCTGCKSVVLTITPETKAFDSSVNEEVPLIQAKKQLGKSAVVSYVIKSKLVKRIVW